LHVLQQGDKMSNDTGKWLPMNLDGSFHSCSQNQTSIGNKKVETKKLSLEERGKRLEDLVIRAPVKKCLSKRKN
jgi:hypothetical protein